MTSGRFGNSSPLKTKIHKPQSGSGWILKKQGPNLPGFLFWGIGAKILLPIRKPFSTWCGITI
jgi:hypothetical protein